MQDLAPRQRGFSLVEILLVLGLIATLAISAFVIYPRVRMSLDVKEAVSKFTVASSSVREFFGNRPYTGLSRAAAIDAGVVEVEDVTTPWGVINLAPFASRPTTLVVVFTDVPSAACKRLLPRIEGVAVQLAVHNVVVKRESTMGSVVAFDPLTSVAPCDDAATRWVQVWM